MDIPTEPSQWNVRRNSPDSAINFSSMEKALDEAPRLVLVLARAALWLMFVPGVCDGEEAWKHGKSVSMRNPEGFLRGEVNSRTFRLPWPLWSILKGFRASFVMLRRRLTALMNASNRPNTTSRLCFVQAPCEGERERERGSRSGQGHGVNDLSAQSSFSSAVLGVLLVYLESVNGEAM